MKVTTFLAIQFLLGQKRRGLFSFLTWMALFGVIVSAAAFVVVEAVMVGFGEDLQNKVIGFSPHVSVTWQPQTQAGSELREQLAALPGVLRVSPLREGEAILRTEDDELQGVKVRGLDPADPPLAKQVQVFFEEGENWASLEAKEEALPGLLLGSELAAEAGVLAAFAETVELLYPFGEVGPTGEVEPNIRRFRVVGTFKSGYFDYDSKFVLVALPETARLFGDYVPETWGLYLKDPAQAEALKARLAGFPGVAKIDTWQEWHERLFSALKLERIGMAIVLTLMILLASFNILSMLMMVVYERRRDLAVLKALGLPETQIAAIFRRAGLAIGIAGGLVGVALGSGICLLLQSFRLPLPTQYYLDALPVRLNPIFLSMTLLLAVLLSWIATLFPAREGRRLTVVEVLRYE
ncbi:MAG TPA: hypothetical protein DF383_07210 [Deltaproteobacteria bacterium]|nr:hypothetical protein [Deltaproteobacteria bacterium]